MSRRVRAEEAFHKALEGRTGAAVPSSLDPLVKLVAALPPASRPEPSRRFQARLRNELLAAASSEEDAFAALLEGAPAEIRPELAPLVRVGHALAASAAAPAEPAPEFRFRLRRSLVEMATPRRSVATRVVDGVSELNQRMRRSLRAVTAAGLAAAMLAGSGAAVAASANSLPGDGLYKVKRVRESAQLMTAGGISKGVKLLGFARTRLQEVSGLVDRDSTQQDLYTDTLGDMDRVTVDGVSIIVVAVRGGAPLSALGEVTRFARTQAQDLSVLIGRLPPGARPAARDSLALAERVGERAQAVLNGCPCPSNPLLDGTVGSPQSNGGIGCDCAIEPGEPSSNRPGSRPAPNKQPTPDEPPPTIPKDPEDEGPLPDVPGTSADEDLNDLIDDLLGDLGVGSPQPLPSELPSVFPSILPTTLPTILPSSPLPGVPI